MNSVGTVVNMALLLRNNPSFVSVQPSASFRRCDNHSDFELQLGH